jgi:hypothetical protein
MASLRGCSLTFGMYYASIRLVVLVIRILWRPSFSSSHGLQSAPTVLSFLLEHKIASVMLASNTFKLDIDIRPVNMGNCKNQAEEALVHGSDNLQ